MRYDAAIIGAGPAGCSCALWLAEYGLAAVLVERLEAPCAGLAALAFAHPWTLGRPGVTLAQLGAEFAAHLATRADIVQRCGHAAVGVRRTRETWQILLDDRSELSARAVVLATGLSPVRPEAWFNPALASPDLLDAVTLTQRRASLAGRRVLLLGGGDNAAENALALARLSADVVLAARSALRAQRRYVDALMLEPAVRLKPPGPMPALERRSGGGYRARWPDAPAEDFDAVAVLFGYRADTQLLELLRAAAPDEPATGLPRGVFLAGDFSARLHPCLPSAVGDGAHAARQVERWLRG